MPPAQRRKSQLLNIWSARVIPVLLLGAIGYVIYLITKTIGIDLCLDPSFAHNPIRKGSGIAIVVLHYVLLLPLVATWLRFFIAVVAEPSFVPLGTPPDRPSSGPSTNSESQNKSNDISDEKNNPVLDRFEVREGRQPCPPGLENFYNKEVFTCSPDGAPRFCNHCWNWKPDRSHHCGELGRCIRKFDHFCPWVGGAVTETSNKFFIQFAFYATLYCTFVLAVCIWAIVQSKEDCKRSVNCSGSGVQNENWIAGIILAAVFGLMAISIAGRFGYFVLVNETTIEELGKGNPHFSIAVRINASEIPRSTSLVPGEGPPTFWVVPYPFRPRVGQTADAPQNRTEHLYAILQPRAGANPWNVGPYRNWKNIMGDKWWDWFIPLRHSPCAKHDSLESDFLLGPDFEELERTFLPHRYDDRKRRKQPLRT